MAAQGMPSFALASVIEDVLRHQGTSPSDADLTSRRFDETALRRYEAARWLRKMAGVVLAKDLPAEPSEDDFRIGLRSGIILCNVLNKVKPGSISKVVEGSNDSVIIHDGSAMMAYQYFENIRNFLDNVQEMGIPTFAASDFEKGGNTARIVGCVLALKSYAESKLGGGGSGSWKFGTNVKPPSAPKPIVRVHSEPHPRTISRSSSLSEKSLDALSPDYLIPDLSDMSNSRLSALVRSAFAGKRPDEIPLIVESILNRIMDEFDHRLAGEEGELMGTTSDFVATLDLSQPPSEPSLEEMQPSSFEEMTEMDDKNDEPPLCDEMTELDHKNDTMPSSCDEMAETDDKNDATHSSCGETNEAGGTNNAQLSTEEDSNTPHSYDKHVSGCSIEKQQSLVQQQQKGVEDLKCNIHSTKQSIQDLQLKYQEDMSLLGKHFYRLAHAASGYQNVLAENRRLYNIVQDLKGNIRVYCRVRPFLRGQTVPSVVDRIEEGTITILTPPKYYKEGKKSFTFNKVFGPKATQVEVFADTQPLVRSVLDGYNVCIFAYGQTGSGKTFTMSGPDDLTEETFGVNYRALNDLFYLSDQRKDTVSYEITVQMMEIYNEQLRDLLSTDGSIKKLDIRNSSQNGINVPDANRLPVASTADVINLMNLGQKNRAVCATAMNDRSSRSHSCLTVHVQGKDLTSGATLRGSMHLVDLAGSERVEKSEVTGDRLKEAVHINKSLSALGDVIAALAQKGAHIPYRNSKLTQLLQDSLGGQAKTLMFVHIAPDPEAVGETLSTLKFAERVSSVELGAAKVNKDSSDVKELKDQIANLKAALARKEEEPDILSCSVRSSSPDSQATKSTLSSSPSHPHPQNTKDPSNGRRSPIGDKKSSSAASRRRSLDPEDLSSWPPLNNGKGDEKQMGTDDWVEKIPGKRENVDRSRSLGTAEEKKSRLTAPYSDVLKRGGDETSFDENDELEAATSDSSEQDIQTLPAAMTIKRVASMPSALGSKLRKPQSKPSSKPLETRSMIPAVPPRRQSLGAIPHSSTAKNERQSVYMKRKTASSK